MSNSYSGKLKLFVTKIDRSNGSRIIGRLNTLQNLPAESHEIDLVHDRGTLQGRLTVTDYDNSVGQFISQVEDSLEVQVGNAYLIFDGYWGERADLILNPAYAWKLTRFQASESIIIRAASGFIATRPDEGTNASRYEKGVWTHEHCQICWATIDEQRSEAYTCEQGHWVCPDCYEAYISRRNIQLW